MQFRFGVVLGSIVISLVACSSDSDGPEPYAAKGTGHNSDAGKVGEVGTAQRRAKEQHCCYKRAYQLCPDTTACFGGVDLNKCVADCAGDDACLTNTCTNQLRNAPPPVGCTPADVPADFPCDS